MKIIMGGRASGKTTEVIKESAEKGFYIVCPTIRHAQSIFCKAKEMGLNIPYPLTIEEFIDRKYYGKNIKGFIFDDLDTSLQIITHAHIETIILNQSGECRILKDNTYERIRTLGDKK
jgi:hypothetical protein